MRFRIQLITQYATPTQIAVVKSEIINPDTKICTIQSIMALIIKVKNPRVKMFIGIVKINIIGRIIALTTPKIKAAIKAVVYESKTMPLIK